MWLPMWRAAPIKVAKQAVLCYALFVANFGYILATSSVFNIPVVGPMIGLNVLLLAMGGYLVSPQQAGEPML